jgi:CRISPR-associated endonuclease/helicase Cas3
MGVTETKRGGRYILPFLRLMSSDLVIDEVDDFDGKDLIAIGRLIHHAGHPHTNSVLIQNPLNSALNHIFDFCYANH